MQPRTGVCSAQVQAQPYEQPAVSQWLSRSEWVGLLSAGAVAESNAYLKETKPLYLSDPVTRKRLRDNALRKSRLTVPRGTYPEIGTNFRWLPNGESINLMPPTRGLSGELSKSSEN